MALIDKASLLMVPSTYEAGTLYNVLPSGNRAPDSTDQNSGYDQTRADFTFDRGSNAAATRVNAEGLIEKYRENLLLQSNSFSTSPFTTSNTSVTSGQSGYDGTTDAWSLTSNGTNGFENLHQIISFSGVYTISVYAKQGSNNYLTIRTLGNDLRVQFKLDDGTHSATFGSPINTFMEDAGSGWYRCGFTANFSSATYVLFYPQIINITTAGNILIQNAQLESGLVATDVLTSGATTAKAGVLIDLPRINYDANGENGALLLEPQRKNVVTNTEYVSSNDYVVGNWTGTITTNTTETLSPEGVYNATKFVKAGASDRVYFHNSQPDGAYTGSIYLKAASGSENKTIEISVRRFGGGSGSTSKLVTITNEWQRFDVTATNLTGGTTTAMYIADFSMDGTATDFYSYGMQIEAGSYVSSYIPNHGESGGVTRAADSCSVTGVSDVIDSTQGTIYFEGNSLNTTIANYSYFITLSDGTQNNRLELRQNGDEIQFLWRVGGTYQGNIQTTDAPITEKCKVALKYSSAEISFYLNGSEVGSIASPTLYSANTLNRLGFDDGTGSNPTQGENSKLIYFNEALSDSELATLTTL